MNSLTTRSTIVIGLGVIGLLLIGALIFSPVLAQGPGGMMGRGDDNTGGASGYGPGSMMGGMMHNPVMHSNMIGGEMIGGGMMHNPAMYNGMMGQGMMSGDMMGGGMMGGGMMPNPAMHSGMMGGGMMGQSSPFFRPDPLTLAEAEQALADYLAGLDDDSLVGGEVMVFENHAYAQIVERETGLGAMEVLIDPVTRAVYPEMGPNMMWNLKYGMMTDLGQADHMNMMGDNTDPNAVGMSDQATADLSAEMSITEAEAVEIAQAYLTAYLPNNLEADEHADPFYGYYTLHVMRDGQTIGMLSVNGDTRQVWLHTWHGDLLEMSPE